MDATIRDNEIDDELDPLDELASITLELQAYLEWQLDSGAMGVPRDTDLARRLRENPLPRFDQGPPAASANADSPSAAHAPVEQGAASEQSHSANTRPALAPPSQVTRSPGANDFAPPVFDAPRRTANKASAPLKKQERVDPHLVVLGATLDELQARVAGCTLCDLHQTRSQTVFSRGTGSSGLCFIGSSPDTEDEAQGQPFVGPAGQLLDKMIEAMGFERDEVYVCSVVKCRPPEDRNPTVIELKTCSPYLRRQLDLLKPQVIVALGSTAVSGLLGLTEGITRLRGSFRLYQGRTAVMPTFAPAYLLRNPGAKRQVWTDLRQVVQHMGRELPRK